MEQNVKNTPKKRPIYILFLAFYCFSGLLFVLAYIQQGVIFKALCDFPLPSPQSTQLVFKQQNTQASLTELTDSKQNYLLLSSVASLKFHAPANIQYYKLASLLFISQIQQSGKLLYKTSDFEQQRRNSCNKDRANNQRFYAVSLLMYLFAGVLLWRRFKHTKQ